MSKSLKRLSVVALAALLAATAFMSHEEDADAGLASSAIVSATVSYTGSAADLIVSFRLVKRSDGRVIWQTSQLQVLESRLNPTQLQFTTTLLPGDWYTSADYEWSCRIDARGASDAVYWVDFNHYLDSNVYTSTVPTSNIKNRVSESLVYSRIHNTYL